MSNNIHTRYIKWLVGLVGTASAFVISYILIMLNIWVVLNVSDPYAASSFTIGFSVGGLAATFLATTFLMLLIHSPVPSIKRIIREANECRALGIITDAQNNKIQICCDEALNNNKKLASIEKAKLEKQIKDIKKGVQNGTEE